MFCSSRFAASVKPGTWRNFVERAFARGSLVGRVERSAEIDCRMEDVIPRHKPKQPVALYLCLDASGHHSYPERWLDARRVASSSVAHLLCVLRHVGHAGAELEEKSEGHSKVPGVELRHELVPRRNDVLGHASVVADVGAVRIALQVVRGFRISCDSFALNCAHSFALLLFLAVFACRSGATASSMFGETLTSSCFA